MSTLSTANIQSKAANTPPVIKDLNGAECGQFCRAWVNFNGVGTVAIRDSFNVASITDNGTGNYTANFTNNMSDANYAASCGAMDGTSVGTATAQFNVTWFATSSSIQVGTWAQLSGTFADREFVHILVFGG